MSVAERIAGRFSASHSGIDRDDARQIACLALVRAVDSYSASESRTLPDFISRVCENALTDEFQKGKRRQRIAPTVSICVLGLVDGDPNFSLRDLRSAVSLNPPADITRGMCEAIGEVHALPFIQCCPAHVDHDFQEWQRRLSRERVRRISERKAQYTVRRLDAMPDALAA
jgi:hypothetical protein